MTAPHYERRPLPPINRVGWRQWLEPLMEYPGAWFCIPRSSPRAAIQLAYALRSGERGTPPGRWEFTSRGSAMWARYLGPDGAE